MTSGEPGLWIVLPFLLFNVHPLLMMQINGKEIWQKFMKALQKSVTKCFLVDADLHSESPRSLSTKECSSKQRIGPEYFKYFTKRRNVFQYYLRIIALIGSMIAKVPFSTNWMILQHIWSEYTVNGNFILNRALVDRTNFKLNVDSPPSFGVHVMKPLHKMILTQIPIYYWMLNLDL